jgi:AcrR family transcriptional regulator
MLTSSYDEAGLEPMAAIIEAPASQEFREKIIEAASRLFLSNGFHASGVDTIVAEAGVAKMTLYKYFSSKEALIVEVLKRKSDEWMLWLRDRVDAIGDTPKRRALAVFDAFQEWFARPDFCGDMFQCAAAEFSGTDNPVHLAARAHHDRFELYLSDLCFAAGCRRPEVSGRRLAIIASGAIATAVVTRRPEVAREARKAAKSVLDD